MDACLANPAASIDLHEVLYGVVTPAGQWGGFWGQGALKKLVAPISSIAGFGLQAFRNNQPRDFKHPSNRSFESAHSDADDFSIGAGRSDSEDSLPLAPTPPSSNSKRWPPSSYSMRPDIVSNQPTRSEAAFTQQGESQAVISGIAHPLALSRTDSEQSASSEAADEPAAPSALPPPPLLAGRPTLTLPAQALVSGSPNTVAKAATSSDSPAVRQRSPVKLTAKSTLTPDLSGLPESSSAAVNKVKPAAVSGSGSTSQTSADQVTDIANQVLS